MRIWFWVLMAIDVIAASIFGFFFLVGLGDNTVSSYNAGLWFMILASLAVILGGGASLRATGHPILAIILLSVLAIPSVLSFLFFIIVLISNPRWN